MIFLTGPFVQYQNVKMPTSPPKALLDEGFHGTAALGGSLAFFLISVLNRGRGREAVEKITLDFDDCQYNLVLLKDFEDIKANWLTCRQN